ncbi:hypothetical protein AGLY_010281 [Aphis glycines]|uniref:THAP-type domain-containing protein n=1 Tax=Aphis glycines TaxID=307491 RepID=A0A6G0TFK4_APHGL|nr:hypothetical protein AGLY_010281 [Aphis glycines]
MIQSGIAKLTIANTSANKNNVPEITDTLSTIVIQFETYKHNVIVLSHCRDKARKLVKNVWDYQCSQDLKIIENSLLLLKLNPHSFSFELKAFPISIMYSGGHTCSLANCTSIISQRSCKSLYDYVLGNKECLSNTFLCADWIENCNPINLPTIDPDVLNRNHRLCSLHFEDKMYSNNKKNRLTNQAIPTLFNNNIICTEDQSSQHDQHVNISSISLDDNTQIESVIIDNPPRCSTSISST